MIKICIADNHKLFRKSLRSLIGTFSEMDVVAEAEGTKSLLEVLRNIKLDIVLIDIHPSDADSYEICKTIREIYPSVSIVILSSLLSKEAIYKSMIIGVRGFFSKNTDPEELEKGIKMIQNNEVYFEASLGNLLYDTIVWDKQIIKSVDELSVLSAYEIEIVLLFCKGFYTSEIAQILGVKHRTVESYRTRIIDKLKAKNFLDVILLAIKFKYISFEEVLCKSI